MAITFRNYYKSVEEPTIQNSTEFQEAVLLLTGVSNSTIVKSLELINGDESSTAYIIRKNEEGVIYSNIRVDLKANDYLLLWQGFFVIPQGHTIYFACNSLQTKIISNVVELT